MKSPTLDNIKARDWKLSLTFSGLTTELDKLFSSNV